MSEHDPPRLRDLPAEEGVTGGSVRPRDIKPTLGVASEPASMSAASIPGGTVVSAALAGAKRSVGGSAGA